MDDINSFVLHGDICYSKDSRTIHYVHDGYLVCEDGISQGLYETLPERYQNLRLIDHVGKLIVPGLVDLHTHAPQFAMRGLGLDHELLDWLNTYTFPEEAKYKNMEYVHEAYPAFVQDIAKGPNTRTCLFATVHIYATLKLMDMLDGSGLVSMVGKVNMDRNCPEYIKEESADRAIGATRHWLDIIYGRYANTTPILTPRFIPACSDELMFELAALQKETGLPVQSHLSENRGEIDWVHKLRPTSESYCRAYKDFGLLGGSVPTIMAHCVWPDDEEIELLRQNRVYIAHCPQSNTNLSSGIAPVRRLLDHNVPVGLGSDISGGCHSSIFRAMADAIQVSKLRYALVDRSEKPLTVNEVFWLGTVSGGSFFGKVGSFEKGYEFDAVVINDQEISTPRPLTIEDRLARVIYLSDDRHIVGKFVRGHHLKIKKRANKKS